MAEVTKEMILDYLIKKGGIVKNVDLVRHFRKHLQIESAPEKDRARIIFKERVNAVAFIKADKNEKYLHLRPEFVPPGGLTRPPTGRPPPGIDHTSENSPHTPVDTRFSMNSDIFDIKSPTSVGSGVVLTSYAPRPSSPPSTITTHSSHQTTPPPQKTPPPSTSSLFNGKSKGLGETDFGESLMAELSSFGSLFDSFGTSGQSSKLVDSFGTSGSTGQSSKPVDSFGTSGSTGQSSKPVEKTSSYATPTNYYSSSSISSGARTTLPPPAPSASTSAVTSSLPHSNLIQEGSPSRQPPVNQSSPSRKPPVNQGSPSHQPLVNHNSPRKTSTHSNGPARKQSGRGQMDMDLDLMSVLSSLPSANPTKPQGKPPGVGTTSYSPQSYQNSTRFDHPKATPQQNSTSFDQPKAIPQQSYQNSTRFDQPKATPQQSYQNSTRFDQPKATSQSYQNSTRFDQPKATSQSYQNSTRFDQPKANPQQSYQNSTRFDQPKATPKIEEPRGIAGGTGVYITHMEQSMTPRASTSGLITPSQLISESHVSPSGRRDAPPPPVRTSSVSHGITDPLPHYPTSNQRRSAPLPPHSTHPQNTPGSKQASSTPTNQSSLGSLELGDLTTSMFSTSAGSNFTGSTSSGSNLTGSASIGSTSVGSTPFGSNADSGRMRINSVPPPQELDNPRPSLEAGRATPPNSRKLGPPVSPHGTGGARSQVDRRQSGGDSSSRRPGSMDGTPPFIRVESPTNLSTGSNSPSHSGRGRSPSGSADILAQMSGSLGSLGALGVQLRNKDGRRNTSSAARRSKNLEKNANLENFTRLSISMTPPAVRKHRPPDVAPKPSRNASRSREDLVQVEGEDDNQSEYDYEDDIDPLEREWMLASAQADIDGLQRLMMTDSTLLNRRGFLHGYTALHWAAKHGRMDILSMLLMQGAYVNIKSNGGLTPLHLAAQAGHDNVIVLLVTDYGADITLRENGGRRPIDMLHVKASERSKSILSNLRNHGFPIRFENSKFSSTFTQPRGQRSSLDRNWNPELVYNSQKEKTLKKTKLSPRSTIRKSFSFKKNFKVKERTSPPRREPTKKQGRKHLRPHSEIPGGSAYDV